MFHNDSLDVQKRIEIEIEICDVFLGLRSPAFSTSPWVRFELDTANRFQKEIVLVDILEGAMPVMNPIRSSSYNNDGTISA
jgi:hypothetical protein